MAWLRYDDAFVDWPEWEHVSADARWAYMALVTACSRVRAWDGRLARRKAVAAILSHDDDPGGRLDELVLVGLVVDDEALVQVVRIADHVPPPGMRDNAEKSKVRMRRKRAHDTGDHSECLPEHCPDSTVTRAVTDRVTRNPGTGRVSSSSHLPYKQNGDFGGAS